MKQISVTPKNNKVISLTLLATFTLASSSFAVAHCASHHKHHAPCAPQVTHMVDYKNEVIMPIAPMFVPHWYAGGHVGVSRTHDNAAAGSGNSVTQYGPGWTADVGYQFIQFYRATLAAELGYTQYHNSNETAPRVNVASTEHFASYLAAVAQYPIIANVNVLGKLGIAYSYAKKVFTATGASRSANTYSPYYGAGISYNMTPQAALVLQWNRARGNNSTGSTDITTLGVSYNFL
ncbi:MAG: outer membrane beta-barrel protein [Gammaproteobacteria bacterium]|nr:outer membrane beta-barrel protein [Gammaproteobacteria bacterium]